MSRGLDFAQLAAVLGGTLAGTVKTALKRRSPPSRPLVARLQGFVAEVDKTGTVTAIQKSGKPGKAAGKKDAQLGKPPAAASQAPDAAARTAARPLEPELLTTLKRRRHLVPKTTSTLAREIGVEVADLDLALAGRAISAAAAGRLQEWAAG